MADPQIKFKRSSVASKRPTLDNVALGEFAINVYDGNLFTRVDTGGVGIATTVSNLTPWTENYGGESITYLGNQTSGVATITASGDATFTGVVTATHFYGDGSNLTGIGAASTENVVTDSLKVIGVSTFQSHVHLGDNDELRFGAGDDFKIYHDPNDARLENSNGDVKFKNTGSYFFFDEDGGETLASFINDGAVNLYYGGNKKFETTGAGINVTGHTETDTLNVSGVSTFQSHVHLGDNDELRIGDGNDLKLWHNGFNSIINDEGVGDLYLGGNSSVNITNGALSEFKAKFITDGAVELYYDNSKKLETTNSGVTVTGHTETDTLQVSNDVSIGVGGTTAFFDVSTGNIGIGSTQPTTKLDVNGGVISTQIKSGIITATSQFYPPILTTTERDAIGFSTGAFIFNETENRLQVYLGSTWASLTVDIDSYSIINM